jgi:hypothetical protein
MDDMVTANLTLLSSLLPYLKPFFVVRCSPIINTSLKNGNCFFTLHNVIIVTEMLDFLVRQEI